MKPSEYPEITDTKAWLAEIDELITEADDIALDIEIANTVSRQAVLRDLEKADERKRDEMLLEFMSTYGKLVDELIFSEKVVARRMEISRLATDEEAPDTGSFVRTQQELESMQSLASRIREKTGAKDLNTLAGKETHEDIAAEAETINLRRTLN